MILIRRRYLAVLTAMALSLCFCAKRGPDLPASCAFVSFSSRSLVSGSGLNFGLDSADTPQIVEMNGKIYAIWSEYITADGVLEIQVSVYNGNDSAPSWTRVVGAGNGLNKSTTADALNPKLAVFNDKLYATWAEFSGGVYRVRVAVYGGDDSAPAWTLVDGNIATGLNKNTASEAAEPVPVAFNSKLYLFWSEQSGGVWQMRAAVYGGDDSAPVWSFVDGNGVNGINKNTARNAETPSAVVYNDKLYLAWQESNGTNSQARVVVYGGDDSAPAWTFIDGNAATGLNYSSAQNAAKLKLAANARDLLLFWNESNGIVTPIRARAYNGIDSNPSWTWIDGGASAGLNADSSYSVENAHSAPFLLGYYIMNAWMQSLGGSQSMRLSYYNGSWALQAGTATANFNFDAAMDASKVNTLVTSSCKVYTAWVEVDNTLGTNFVHVGVLR